LVPACCGAVAASVGPIRHAVFRPCASWCKAVPLCRLDQEMILTGLPTERPSSRSARP
jgi:hypothetical protein